MVFFMPTECSDILCTLEVASILANRQFSDIVTILAPCYDGNSLNLAVNKWSKPPDILCT